MALSFGCRVKENPQTNPQEPNTQSTDIATNNIVTNTTVLSSPISPTLSPYTPTASTTPTRSITPTAPGTSIKTVSVTLPGTKTPTLTGTKTPTSISTFPTVTRLKLHCLDVLPTLSSEVLSGGIVMLGHETGGTADQKQRIYYTTFIDMATGQQTQIVTQDENQDQHIVSPDRNYIAFDNLIFNPEKDELVIASYDGQRLITIPHEKKWGSILGWTNDQRLLLSYDEPVIDANGKQKTLNSYLVLDPFRDNSMILRPNFPNIDDYLNYQPFWNGWNGIIYDTTLTRAIYLRFIGSDEDRFTFAIWDVEKQQLISTLEEIYTESSSSGRAAPMPVWAPDGSYFFVMGQNLTSDGQVMFELYRVSRDGQVEQLTHLTSVAIIKGYTFSLSQDGRKIALYFRPKYDGKQSHLAVLDLETLDVTDYCIPERGYTDRAPIWSPDSTQFLVTDQYDQDHRRVILVDITKDLAVDIAEDIDTLGWMVNP